MPEMSVPPRVILPPFTSQNAGGKLARRGLSAAGRSDQGSDFPLFRSEADIVENAFAIIDRQNRTWSNVMSKFFGWNSSLPS